MAQAREKLSVSAGGSRDYSDLALVAPVTVPYVRYSIRSAHWFVAQALARLLKASKLDKSDIDGLSVGSFSLAPDTAIGLTQHLGLTVRWLDHIPLGGACGIVALRRALRAVQAGDADVVACIGADTNHVDSFRQSLGSFSVFARDAVFPYGSGGPNASFAFLTSYYMRKFRRDARGLRQAVRRSARQRARLPARPVQKDAHARGVSGRAADRRSDPPVRLRHALRRRRGVSGHDPPARAGARPALCDACAPPASATTPFPRIPIQMRGAGSSIGIVCMAAPASSPADIDFVQTYDDYPVMSVIQLEDLGFCAKGEGAEFIRRHSFTTDGSFPLNTSGGQLSVGQAGCAAGFLGLVESIRQLTDRNLARAVPERALRPRGGFRHDHL